MSGALGTGGSWTEPDRIVIHFGSPEGTQFGSDDKRAVEDFQRRHPEFVIDPKEES